MSPQRIAHGDQLSTCSSRCKGRSRPQRAARCCPVRPGSGHRGRTVRLGPCQRCRSRSSGAWCLSKCTRRGLGDFGCRGRTARGHRPRHRRGRTCTELRMQFAEGKMAPIPPMLQQWAIRVGLRWLHRADGPALFQIDPRGLEIRGLLQTERALARLASRASAAALLICEAAVVRTRLPAGASARARAG